MSLFHTDPAVLVLEDGTRFRGRAYGARGVTLGEVVFATGMTGYQETLTDPSYAGQIVLQTAPHMGRLVIWGAGRGFPVYSYRIGSTPSREAGSSCWKPRG